MDYRNEVAAFNGQLEAGTLSACEIALWHALHDVGIQCGHSDGLSIATVTLTARTGFSASSVKRARDKLRDKGFIRYASRGSNRAALYEIMSVVHGEPQDGPRRGPRDGPQGEPQGGPRGGPLYTISTTSKMDVVNKSAHGEPQNGPQDEPHGGLPPLMTDAEMDAARELANAVYDAAQAVGIPQTAADLGKADRLIADYSAPWVLEAIRRAGDGPASARCWRYVAGVLRKWREKGGIDDRSRPGNPDEPAQREQEAARRRYQERSERILRGEYDP